MYFNSVNFTFLLLLFPFQCRFYRVLFWFYFTTKIARGHVHNSWGKSTALALSDSPEGVIKQVISNWPSAQHKDDLKLCARLPLYCTTQSPITNIFIVSVTESKIRRST